MSIEFTIVCFNYKVLDYIRLNLRNGANIERERSNRKNIIEKYSDQSIELHSHQTCSSLTSYKYVFVLHKCIYMCLCGKGFVWICVRMANTHNQCDVPSDSIQFNRLKSKLIHIQSEKMNDEVRKKETQIYMNRNNPQTS